MDKERHSIDDFFREALDNYPVAPSEGAREAFLKDAEGILKNSSIKKWWTLLFPLIVILLSSGIFTYFEFVQATGKEKQDSLINSDNTPVIDEVKDNQSLTAKIPTYNTKNKETEKLKVTAAASGKKLQKIISDTTVSFGSIPPPSNKSESAENISQLSDTLIRTSFSTSLQDTSDKADEIKTVISVNSVVNREWTISAGLNFSPEWMFHTVDNTKSVTGFGLEGTFRFGKYSIRTGAGISITKGTNQLLVEYNDYLGSYMKLDSISFGWDSKHYYLVPTYYMSEKNVYDSLMKLENAKILRQYTYLQVPIILGYDFIRKEKVSFGLRAGPVMSILLGEKTLTGDYDPGKNQIISINEITPEQVNLNWQIMIGINATIYVTRNLGIEIEPFGKYYFNSVHETSSGSGKPWSVGIRAAVFMSFQ